MILITGTYLDVSELPHADMLDYTIENKPNIMSIKLKSVAKSPTCFQIYIAEANRTDYTVTDDLLAKIVYFKDDDELIRMLEGGVTSQEKDIFADDFTPEPPVEAPPDFSEIKRESDKLEAEEEKKRKKEEEKKKKEEEKRKKKETSEKSDTIEGLEIVEKDTKLKSKVVKANLEKSDESSESSSDNTEDTNLDINTDVDESKSTEDTDNSEISFIPNLDIEEANTELPESMLSIPNLSEDTDSLREQLQNKDRIIAQKDAMIKELRQSVDDTYKMQEIQLLELETMWTQKLTDAQATIKELEGKITGVSLDEESANFLKFLNYAQSNKAIVKEGFIDSDKAMLDNLRSKFTIFACGSGDSNYSMLKQVRRYIESAPSTLIIDFSNDNFLASTFKIKSQMANSMSLLKDDVNPISLIKDIKGAKIIPTTNFNDIVLLSIDWAYLLKKIDDVANGNPVVLMFGNINSFNIRFTVSKLASMFKLYVFVKCSPIILSALYSDAQFIPKNRVNLVALEYIDVVKSILSELAKSFNVLAFASEVDWKKLKIK